jgi:hypothetical protein
MFAIVRLAVAGSGRKGWKRVLDLSAIGAFNAHVFAKPTVALAATSRDEV